MEKKEILDAALNALDRLMRMFVVERYVHLVVTLLSFLLMLFAGYQIIAAKAANTELLVALFGGSGLFTISSARISWFFSRAFTIVEDLIKRISQ